MNSNTPDGRADKLAHVAYQLPAIAHKDEIRSTRKLLALSQEDFAALFGVTEYTVWRWEHAKRSMSEEQTRMLRKIGDERLFSHLGDSVDEVGDSSEDKAP